MSRKGYEEIFMHEDSEMSDFESSEDSNDKFVAEWLGLSVTPSSSSSSDNDDDDGAEILTNQPGGLGSIGRRPANDRMNGCISKRLTKEGDSNKSTPVKQNRLPKKRKNTQWFRVAYRKKPCTNDAVIVISDDDEPAVSVCNENHGKLLTSTSAAAKASVVLNSNAVLQHDKLSTTDAYIKDGSSRSDEIEKVSTVVCNDVKESKPHDGFQGDQVPYYLKDFKLVIDTVLSIDDDAKLFECEEDSVWIKKFQRLDVACQQLYVRLYHRKPSWLPLHKISYSTIPDVPGVLKLLSAEGLLLSSEHESKNTLSISEMLQLIQAPAIKIMGKSFHLQTNCNKQNIVKGILQICEKQRSIAFGSSMADVVRKKAQKALGVCYKVAPIPKKVFNRMLLVFDVTKGIVDDSEYSLTGTSQPPFYGKHPQLSSILLAGLGRTVYPSYTISRPTAIFQTRQDLLEYEAACQLQLDAMNACEAGNWRLASEICEKAEELRMQLSEDSRTYAESLPCFLRGFTSFSVYTRIRSLQVEILQRLKEYKKASMLLRKLLEQKHFCISRRPNPVHEAILLIKKTRNNRIAGYWAERLALNYDQHLRDPVSSWNAIQDALRDELVRGKYKVALKERADKLKNNSEVKSLEPLDLCKPYEFLKAKEVTIAGRILPKRMQTGKARFMARNPGPETDDVVLCSVEELALAHYNDSFSHHGLNQLCPIFGPHAAQFRFSLKSEGYEQGMHAEGGVFSCLFGLLMWDIIFMPGIPDVFRTPYQSHPLDLHTDEFYQSRKGEIDARLQHIHDWETDDFSVSQQIMDTWEKHFDVSCFGMSWERFSSAQQAVSSVVNAWRCVMIYNYVNTRVFRKSMQKAQKLSRRQDLAKCIGGPLLSKILRILSMDFRHRTSGMPDLTVWSPSCGTYKLVEVKGPGDRLQSNQKLWMHDLVSLGVSVEVCHVTAHASRKLQAT